MTMSGNRWYLRMLGICLLLEMHRIYAKPLKHFGRCDLSSGISGYCVPNDECIGGLTTLSDEIHRQCFSTVKKNLVCCPDNRPVKKSELKIPQPGECGISFANRIIGGNVTHIQDFPWMALLRFTSDDEEFTNRCGGSLIHPRWILTAAHCVPDETSVSYLKHIRLGEWNTTTDIDCQQFMIDRICAPEPQDFEIDRIIVHEQYAPVAGNDSPYNYAHDIALIKLTQSVVYSDFIQPICLPAANLNVDYRYAGYAMDIAGWGNTETINVGGSPIKLKTTVNGISRDVCTNANGKINAGQICASGSLGYGTCSGDSGGPLMLLDSNGFGTRSYYLVGIISLGARSCNNRNRPMIFTRVEHYIPWITATMLSNS